MHKILLATLSLSTLSLALLLSPAHAKEDPEPLIEAGQEDDLETPDCIYPTKLYIPSDYKPGMRMPLIIFMHGSGGKPTTWPWKTATGGKGYIIAGIPYGAFDDGGSRGARRDPASCRAMIAFIEKVRALIDELYGVDQKSVILSGLSMGGWGTNFYGFHDDARGRYRAYAILAAGPLDDVDHTVAEGLPVMLLNGSEDANLATANRGRPLLEKAGALVTQVVLPNEPHVPSTEGMAKPLRNWLESIRKADQRANGIVAVKWNDVLLGEVPTKNDNLVEFMAKKSFVTKADKTKPILIFFVSHAKDKKGKPTNSATKSEALAQLSFTYPLAAESPLAARHYTCFRIDVSRLDKKSSPRLHEALSPQLVLLGVDRTQTNVLSKSKVGAAAATTALRTYLTPEQINQVDEHAGKLKPLLKELKELMKQRESLLKSLGTLRRKGPSKKLATKQSAFESVDAKIDSIAARLHE